MEVVEEGGWGVGIAVGGGMFVELGGVLVEAAGPGGVAEGVEVAGMGVAGGCGPEVDGRDGLVAVAAAVLAEVVGQQIVGSRRVLGGLPGASSV
ncbi:hypothetical protein OG788_46140 [Streptomyces sp. NBC_00647]|uniref:hypothetical protein n=1 Tax=Streptomyces sp. NBC_00647 TaxID=2975796 RepID=UPI00324B1A6D